MLRAYRFLLASATALALGSATLLASADAYEAAVARAIAAKEKALTSNDPADWQEAERRFEEADRVRSTPETKYEIAVAASHLKEEDVATETFERAIADGLSGAPREKAQAYVDEHKPKLALLQVEGPAGAEVWVVGRRRGVLPLARPITIFSGTSAVRVVDGSTIHERSIVAKEGEAVLLDVRVPKAAVITRPQTTPVTPPQSATVDANPSHALDWTLVIGGGALVALGGAGFFVSGANIAEYRESLATNCVPGRLDGETCGQSLPGRNADAQADADSIVSWKGIRIASIAVVGVGLVSLAWGTVRFLGGKSSTARAPWTVAAAPSASGGFFALRGSF